MSNVFLAELTPNFKFYLYTVDARDKKDEVIDSSARRNELIFKGLREKVLNNLPEKTKKSVLRAIFPTGSAFFSANEIKGLDPSKLPYELVDGTGTGGDTAVVVGMKVFGRPAILQAGAQLRTGENEVSLDFRCADCTAAFSSLGALLAHCEAEGHSPVYGQTGSGDQPMQPDLAVFNMYANLALQKAFQERMARWGRAYIDPNVFTEPTDRGKSLGIKVFRAFHVEFNILRPDATKAQLALTVDLRAKIIRTKSVLHAVANGRDLGTLTFSDSEKKQIKRQWTEETVISMIDKTCFSVHDIIFDHSPDTLMIDDLNMSHTEYFQKRKGVKLMYPKTKVMVAVLGRRQKIIHL